ncbi:MAG: sigma-54-dependent Fis family transcriptional regulator [Aquabacterium sp.]|uniref:sigma-54-dependent Fis family transcriptional regulator n=1 Tax=Aquabacterium sp. TaxID=1872578 RepID=UPI001225D879|nr:sigma-54-dependent Fis family transcriptional regulator [Aquabacterium sp.]TAK93215.1 MAG: sigma-54-dependent Fis family transcriptional regulator [Aquabacterium sp.]
MPQRLEHRPSATELQQARRWMLEHGEVPQGMVSESLSRSWQRSHHAGLSPVDMLPDQPLCSAPDLKQALERQREFLAHARPVMEFVFDQMQGSGNLVVLSDAGGLLLHSLGDTDFVDRADRVALRPGALWHEADRGTNAIGTALADQRPVVIHGAEHYLERNSFLTCAAAPVRTSAGRLQGVLDISGDQRAHHPHTFALVRSAARMIEDRLFHARHSRDQILRLHHLPEGLGAVGEGLVALSDDGWVVGANALAQQWLGLDETRIGTGTLDQLTGIQSRLMPPGRIMRLHTPGDRALFGRMDPRQRPVLNMAASSGMPSADVSPLSSNARQNTPRETTPRQNAPTSPPDTPAPADPRLQDALHRARRVQAQGIAVLVQGESGSGKEVFARALHAEGDRAHKPFVAVNCAALPETLIEAELFGYVGGAFTGARREGSPGRIREADGGTLFLDEIGDMPLSLQARLLRVLQDKVVMPLGGSKPQPVDFVLVCATHRKLRDAIAVGTFREDLYYRLNGLTVSLPALRERQDFDTLVRQMLDQLCADMRRAPVDSVHPGLMQAMSHYPWPGNLRQLHGLLRTVCALLDPDERTLDWHHLPEDMVADLRAAPLHQQEPRHGARHDASQTDTSAAPGHEPPPATVSMTPGPDANLRRLSDLAIQQVVESTQGNMSEAARRLGISRNTLYRRIKQIKA